MNVLRWFTCCKQLGLGPTRWEAEGSSQRAFEELSRSYRLSPNWQDSSSGWFFHRSQYPRSPDSHLCQFPFGTRTLRADPEGWWSPYMVKCYGFPLSNVFWQDVNLWQTTQQEAFYDAWKPLKSIFGQAQPGPCWGSSWCSLRLSSQLGRKNSIPIPHPSLNAFGILAWRLQHLKPLSYPNPRPPAVPSGSAHVSIQPYGSRTLAFRSSQQLASPDLFAKIRLCCIW